MATFVLIHGACMGGVFWEPVASELRKSGHRVFRPSLTGCGGQKHLLTKSVGLDTHVQDIVTLIEYEDLRDVIMVGHSYSGCVVTQVPEHVGDRLAGVVYCDAIFPDDGQSGASVLPQSLQDGWNAHVASAGDGFKLTITDHVYSLWGVKSEDVLAWIKPRLCPFPYKALTDPLSLPTRAVESLRGKYYLGANPDAETSRMFRPFAEKARKLGWDVVETPYGHFPHVEGPGEIARGLHEFAS